MINLITVQLKCPHCGHSMMDAEHHVDNESSVKLYIRVGDKEGFIWLSSVYGSYNFESNVAINEGEIALFRCTHCFHELTSNDQCEECHAPMVDFHLNSGGKVSICSRAGCKKHSVEFEDLSTALSHFFHEYEFIDHAHYEHIVPVKSPKVKTEDKDKLASGSFLNSYCPHCKMNLISNNMIIFKIEKEGGEKGILYLSPFLNVFTHTTTIKIPEKAQVTDVKCIFCDQSLVHQDIKCPKCTSDLVRINVSAMKRMIDFYFCSRKGCKWHGLSDEDLNYIKLEDSQEW